MKLSQQRIFFVFEPLSRETVDKFISEHPVQDFKRSDIAYDLWLEKFLDKLSLFYKAQREWFTNEVRIAFGHQFGIDAEESISGYELQEEWQQEKVDSGLEGWSIKTDNLIETIYSESDQVKKRIGLEGGAIPIRKFDVFNELYKYDTDLNEYWFNQTINNSQNKQISLKQLFLHDYQRSPHWKRLRNALFLIHGGACQEVLHYASGISLSLGDWNVDMHIQVINDENRGNERFKEVILLCKQHYYEWRENLIKFGEPRISYLFNNYM
jgi:hypothetical protein